MSLYDRPALYCQDCGDLVRYLTPEEVQRVARDPYAYIAYCYVHFMDLQQRINNQRGVTL